MSNNLCSYRTNINLIDKLLHVASLHLGILRWMIYQVTLLRIYVLSLIQGEVLTKKALQLRHQQSAFRNDRVDSNATVRLDSGSYQWFGIFTNRRSSVTNTRQISSIKMVINPLSRMSSLNRPDKPRSDSMDGRDESTMQAPAITVPPMDLEGVSNDNENRRFQSIETDTGNPRDDKSIHLPEVTRLQSRTISSLEQSSWTMERLISIELTEMMYQIHSFSSRRHMSTSGSSERHLSETVEASMALDDDQQQSSTKRSFLTWWR